ncbi:putative toxin [Nocardia alni]|uniref:putative toxin n=1 Tax=Nocardia alni TaxID=2815723 RepID=UPI001C2460EE|nr:putative toxin [Nocardia alni]
MTDLDVDPDLFYESGSGYDTASQDASSALKALDTTLRQAINMTGGDPGGKEWGAKYSNTTVEASVVMGDTIQVLVRMAALLRQTGVSHDQSEEASQMNGPDADLPPGDPGGATYTMRPPKDPSGGSRPKPTGWDIVMPGVTWINGDVAKLRDTSDAWSKAHGTYYVLGKRFSDKIQLLLNSTRTPELTDIQEINSTILDALSILADATNQQAGGIDGYAEELNTAQQGIEFYLNLQVVVQSINVLGSVASGGTVTRVAAELAEAEVDNAREAIQKYLDNLADARRVTMNVLDAVSLTATGDLRDRIYPLLQRLPESQPPTKAEKMRENRLRGARAEARAGIDPTKKKTSIISRSGAKNRIPDDIDRESKTLTEVKNVNYQAYTSQIDDFYQYTQTNGYKFNLIVDAGTKLDPKIENLAQQGKINVVRMDLSS